MESLSATLTQDHHRCDELFARAEERVSRADWIQADRDFSEFARAMEHHLDFEEHELFPAFEEITGNRDGPTLVMRLEHQQMRAMFRDMRERVRHRDTGGYLGQSETLLILMQQHNMKEEHMLYRMAELALGEKGPALAARLSQS
jgi:hemerythrin-like domain-containing protein